MNNSELCELAKKQENRGDIEKAYSILQENNILSSICSRVCPSENQCMGSCIRGIKQNSVQINTLERYVNDVAEEKNIKLEIRNLWIELWIF